MIKEQSNSFENWFLFDDRNIIQDGSNYKSSKYASNTLMRPLDYCNLPLAKFHEDENFLGNDWKLKHVFMFSRHGQRASVSSMAESNYQYHINCSLRQFLSFKIHDWKDFINSLDQSNSSITSFDSKEICKESQLTMMGILQMFILGSRLNSAYQKFLKSSLPVVFSTSYQRTLFSAEILQYQLLKSSGNSQHYSKIQESQSLVFCRSNTNISCQCPSLRYFYSKYNRFKSNLNNQNIKCANLIDKFNSIFSKNNPSVANSINSLEALFDIVSSALCASNIDEIGRSNFFCWPLKGSVINQESWSFLYKNTDGEDESEPSEKSRKNKNSDKRCIPVYLIIDLWNCVDEIATQVNNFVYFRKYSKLAVYPILDEIISSVSSKVSYSNIENNNSKKPHNLVIFMGHDYTIRYLLSALDFQKSIDKSIYNVINLWPGFASRLILEIFENVQKSSIKMKFRLLYNGLDITNALIFCPSNQSGCDFRLLQSYLKSNGFWDENLFSNTTYSQQCLLI